MSYEGVGQAGSHESIMNPLLGNVANSASKSSGPSASHSWFVVDSGADFRYALLAAEDDSLEWAARKLPEFLEKYRGQWILVKDKRLITSSFDPIELLQQAIELRIEKPLMLKIEPPPTARRSAFVAW